MKKIIYSILILSLVLFVKVPKYNELNNIHIIDRISIECDESYYFVKYREIISKREDNGIAYKYKNYKKNIRNDNSFDLTYIFDDDEFFYDKAIIKNKCSSLKIKK